MSRSDDCIDATKARLLKALAVKSAPAAQLRHELGLSHELIYAALVSLEADGLARPVSHSAGDTYAFTWARTDDVRTWGG